MKRMGIDVGSRRIGIAVTDPDERVVLPMTTLEIPEGEDGIDQVAKLAREAGAEALVVGLPLSLSGAETPQTVVAKQFALRLAENLGIEVDLFDERLSSVGAKKDLEYGKIGRRRGTNRRPKTAIDQKAAAIILEAFIGARRNNSGR